MQKNTERKFAVLILPIFLLIALFFASVTVYAVGSVKVTGDSKQVSVHIEGQKTKKDINGKENHVYSIPVPGGGWTSDDTVSADEFSFTVTPAKNNPKGASGIPKSVSTLEGGRLDFGTWVFKKQGTYSYTVSEDRVKGWKHPEDVTVTIVVTKEADGKFYADVSYSHDQGFLFVNESGGDTPEEEPLPGSIALDGVKVLLKGEEVLPVSEGQFTFILTADKDNASAGFTLPETLKAQVKKDGTFSFDEITISKEGQYVFYISEEPGGLAGYTYDTSLYTIYVSASVDENNTLAPVITSILKNGEAADAVSFLNTYEEKELETSLNLTGMKQIEGDRSADEIREGDFRFTVTPSSENDADAYSGIEKTVDVQAGGSIDFGTWVFQREGTYVFEIEEVRGTKEGYIYDTSVIEVTVKVSYSESEDRLYTTTSFKKDGKAVKSGAPITFINEYREPTPPPTGTPSVTPPPGTTTTPTPGISGTPTPGTSRTPSRTPGKAVSRAAVKTGDENDITVWIVLIVAAAAAAAAAVIVRRRRRKRGS